MNPDKILQDLQSAVSRIKNTTDAVESQIACNIIGARIRDLAVWCDDQLNKLHDTNTEEKQ